jgi:hypothetical protein
MILRKMLLVLPMVFAASLGKADVPPLRPVVSTLEGHLFDEDVGAWAVEDAFADGYVPYNKMSTPLLVVATIDFGKVCAMPRPSSDELRQKAPLSRPRACEKLVGSLSVTMRYGDGSQERQDVALSKFSPGPDGTLHVPVLFYRRSPCVHVEVAAQTSFRTPPAVRKVNFVCHE